MLRIPPSIACPFPNLTIECPFSVIGSKGPEIWKKKFESVNAEKTINSFRLSNLIIKSSVCISNPFFHVYTKTFAPFVLKSMDFWCTHKKMSTLQLNFNTHLTKQIMVWTETNNNFKFRPSTLTYSHQYSPKQYPKQSNFAECSFFPV